jgi:hypothetical protein
MHDTLIAECGFRIDEDKPLFESAIRNPHSAMATAVAFITVIE